MERRGHPREIVEALVAAGADREYFADKRQSSTSSRRRSRHPTRSVTVQPRRGAQPLPAARSTIARTAIRGQHTIGVDFVTSAEYRTLVANRRDHPDRSPAKSSSSRRTTAADAPNRTADAGRAGRSRCERPSRSRGKRAIKDVRLQFARRARRLLHRRRPERASPSTATRAWAR